MINVLAYIYNGK